MAIRIVVVDDSPDFLQVAPSLLSAHPAVEVAGIARTGGEALRMVGSLKPDLVVMDLIMPSMDGITITKRIRSMPSPPDVVIASFYNSVEFERLALDAGARAFISKDRFVVEIFSIVEAQLKERGTPPAAV